MFDPNQVPSQLHEATRKRFDDFYEVLEQRDLERPESLLPQEVSGAAFREQMNTAFAASEYIAKTATTRPELLLELVRSGALFAPLEDGSFPDLVEAVAACEDDGALDKVLRRERHRAMVRIIWRDLNRLGSMREITDELSRF